MSIKIVIWTKAPPKVNAIEECIKNSPYFKWEKVELIPLSVDSWISDMPLSIDEDMQWAKNRAIECQKEIPDGDFFVWMEWGTTIFGDKAYLFWVAYIMNSKWEWHYWISPMMEVPKLFKKRLYENQEDLWKVLSEVTWIENASKKNWSFWAWSDDTLTRKDQFMLAFYTAIPAFFNKYYKL